MGGGRAARAGAGRGRRRRERERTEKNRKKDGGETGRDRAGEWVVVRTWEEGRKGGRKGGRTEKDIEKNRRRGGKETEKGRRRNRWGQSRQNGPDGRGRRKTEEKSKQNGRQGRGGKRRKWDGVGQRRSRERRRRGGKGQDRDEKGGRPYACRPSVADRPAIRPGRGRSRRDRPARACPTGGPGRAAARCVGAGPAAHRRHASRVSPQPSFP